MPRYDELEQAIDKLDDRPHQACSYDRVVEQGNPLDEVGMWDVDTQIAQACSRGQKRTSAALDEKQEAVDVTYKQRLGTLSTHAIRDVDANKYKRRSAAKSHAPSDEEVVRSAWDDMCVKYCSAHLRMPALLCSGAVAELWKLYDEAVRKWPTEFKYVRPIIFVYALGNGILNNGMTIDGLACVAAVTRCFAYPTKKSERSVRVCIGVTHGDRKTVEYSCSVRWSALSKTAGSMKQAWLRLRQDTQFMRAHVVPRCLQPN
jgi:hypothetical protein